MISGLRYGVEVRSAQPADAAEAARLLAIAGLGLTVAEVADRLEAIRLQASAGTLVATGYPGLSGLVALSWSHLLQELHPVARITMLVVDPEERRRGIGRLLLKAAAQSARMAGCHAMEFDIPGDDGTAETFALAAGFLPHGRVLSRVLRKRAS